MLKGGVNVQWQPPAMQLAVCTNGTGSSSARADLLEGPRANALGSHTVGGDDEVFVRAVATGRTPAVHPSLQGDAARVIPPARDLAEEHVLGRVSLPRCGGAPALHLSRRPQPTAEGRATADLHKSA
eukprot:CAMPEP_0113937876 /NCGR_PEP_ID=MMETSP1339-20121228/4379_1 /TAXON_ID=94617 /ORGANISM="Fibrocapsa japonica" /LENGTH=126 /DNA_ID=CAMNT_0000940783 /DNA_START=179 /DNA_END=559 /DNA_ORIENTATION=+ /assembly_acc=CAM_ASM_000762